MPNQSLQPSLNFIAVEALKTVPILDGATGRILLTVDKPISSTEFSEAVTYWRNNELPALVQAKVLQLNADRDPAELASLISATAIQRDALRPFTVTHPGGSISGRWNLDLEYGGLKGFAALLENINSFQARMHEAITKLPVQKNLDLLFDVLRYPTHAASAVAELESAGISGVGAIRLVGLIEHNFLVIHDRSTREKWRYNPIEVLDNRGNPNFLVEYSARIVEIQVPTDRGVLSKTDVSNVADHFRSELLALTRGDEYGVAINSAGVFDTTVETEGGRATVILVREPVKREVITLSLPDGVLAGAVDFSNLKGGALTFDINNLCFTLHQSPFEDRERMEHLVDQLKIWIRNEIDSRVEFQTSHEQSSQSELTADFIELLYEYYPELGVVLRGSGLTPSQLFSNPNIPLLQQAGFVLSELERHREYLATMTAEDSNTMSECLSDFLKIESNMSISTLIASIPHWQDLCELPVQTSPNVDYDLSTLTSELEDNVCFIRLSSPFEYHALLSRLNEQGRETVDALTREHLIAVDSIPSAVVNFLNTVPTDTARSAIIQVMARELSVNDLPSDIDQNRDFIFLRNLEGYNNNSWQTATVLPLSSRHWKDITESNS